MNCEKCNSIIPKEEEVVTCGKCKANLHFQCSGRQRSNWKSKNIKKKAEWECENCTSKTPQSPINTDSADTAAVEDPVYSALKGFLEKMFSNQEKIISKRVDSKEKLINDLDEKFTKTMDKVKRLEEENQEIRKCIEELRVSHECEKQYNRSKNVIITSIPQSEKEDVSSIVVDLLAKMNINLRKEDFTAHRLPANHNRPPIILQCTTRSARDSIVRKARKLKPKLSLIQEKDSDVSIYFNDHLTPYFAKLMTQAKHLKIEKNYKYIWLNGNCLMLRKDYQSKAIKVERESDLDKL